MRFGPYVVEASIGQGGMGAVARVRHVETDVRYALKVILTSVASRDLERALGRFRREVEVVARVGGHPGIARVHTCGTEQGMPWYVMDFVEGTSLGERWRLGIPPPEEGVQLVVAVADALSHVHEHGVFHRDLKPENVLIESETGRPKLVDFGLAYDLAADRLTRTGDVVGTPAFMAPEQVQSTTSGEGASAPGPETDVYGLGAVLYFTLTGEPPFHGKAPMSLLVDVIKTPPKPPSRLNAAVPAALDAICLRALAKKPGDRYPSIAELGADLERWLRGESTDAGAARSAGGGRRGAVAAVVVVLAIVTAVGLVAGRGRDAPGRAAVLELEAALQRGEPLSPDEDALARALPESPRLAGDAELAARAELVALLAAATARGEVVRAEAAGVGLEIARLVRTDGAIDQSLLRRARRVLDEADRPDLLAVVLHGAEPVAIATPLEATGVARALVEDEGLAKVGLPDDRAAFGALYRAPGLADAARGRLLILRADRRRAALDDAPDDAPERAAVHAAALADYVAAHTEHGVAPDATGWSPSFHHAIHRGFEDALAERLDEARAILRLLGRVTDGGVVPPAPLIGRLHQRMVLYMDVSATDEASVIRSVAIAAFLERYGAWVSTPSDLKDKRPPSWAAVLRRLGDEEARRPADRRDPSWLLFLVLVLCRDEAEMDRLERWVEAALETGTDAAWLHGELGSFHGIRGAVDASVAAFHRAWELDRARPAEVRWPDTPFRIAHRMFEAAEDGVDLEPIIDLAVEAAQVQLAVVVWLESIGQAGGVPPWRLSNPRGIAALLNRIGARLIAHGPPDCCDGEISRADQVIDAALALLTDEYLGFRNTVSDYVLTPGVVRGLRGLHHEEHGRLDAALVEIGEAITAERSRTSMSVDGDRNRAAGMATWLEHRARVLRELGRDDEASADEAEAKTLRDGAR